ncbi:choline ABC transporter ATP-binding protein [Aureimonas sp. AU22]|uniref:choline ABC transporter ATP-binding protein n=1 Tax=Aureimonas sp. AU22 TaxID=1638162 RepID=UPI0007867581|nr:choline ABC transporter ATP-binding protein [Aureimonas sp. AU22]
MSAPLPHPAIELKGVDIVFGKRPQQSLALLDRGATRDEILDKTGAVLGAAGVDLSIEQGEICVLMGLSGSGKSTVLRSVNRLVGPARGQVLVSHEGQVVDVTRCDAATLRRLRMTTVSMVFQQFALLPWRTVRENVGLGLELQGLNTAERQTVVDAKLAMVGLTAWADKHTHELSGGMQQRVGLARAFATDAPILLMDEPFSALDPLIRTKLQDELLTLQAEARKTILFVSHDLDEALKLGSRIAIMQDARIVQVGTGADILLNPATPYVAEFVRHVNPLNVLRGGSVMRPARAIPRDGGDLLLDGDGRVRLSVDAERRPVAVSIDGQGGTIGHANPEDGQLGGTFDVVTAPVDLKLRAAIALKRRTDHPIVLLDHVGRLAGLCDHDEIYRGLLQRAPR